jgi:F-box domain
MPSIPIDVLREILEHVRKADLPTLCRVNKVFCSYSQDVLYREIKDGDAHVVQTLAQSTDLARRVRSFATTRPSPELATALRNMSSLRWLSLWNIEDDSILDGCTFKLDKLFCDLPNSKPLQQFINSPV